MNDVMKEGPKRSDPRICAKAADAARLACSRIAPGDKQIKCFEQANINYLKCLANM